MLRATISGAGKPDVRVGQPVVLGPGERREIPDLLFRPDPGREDAILGHVRDLGLNMLRLEAKIPGERLIERADELGIPLMVGSVPRRFPGETVEVRGSTPAGGPRADWVRVSGHNTIAQVVAIR